jgi:TPR repeat protein
MKQRIKAFLAGGAVALALFGAAIAEPLGEAAFKRGDYATALVLLRPFAEGGNAVAQFDIGVMYWAGFSVQQDYAKALSWLTKAAEQGNAPAQRDLGAMYEWGDGVPQDNSKAWIWYLKAAEQGNTLSQFALGEMYFYGRPGVPTNSKEAFRLLHPFADQGNARAQHFLGEMYSEGKGVPQDYELAHMWFNLAAGGSEDSGEVDARCRDEMAAKMTPAKIAEAQKMAREWKPTK